MAIEKGTRWEAEEFALDASIIMVVPLKDQKRRLENFLIIHKGNREAALKAFEKSYGYKFGTKKPRY